MDGKQILLDWLQDAYEMEETTWRILEGYVIDAEEYPLIDRIIERQIKETKSQAAWIRTEIVRLGGQPLEIESRDLIEMTSPFQYTAMDMDRDRVIKNAITQHAFEHFNHASYVVLAKTAEFYGEEETARICQEIMREDMLMAKEIEKILPELTDEFLRHIEK